jgi:hypothetical protein
MTVVRNSQRITGDFVTNGRVGCPTRDRKHGYTSILSLTYALSALGSSSLSQNDIVLASIKDFFLPVIGLLHTAFGTGGSDDAAIAHQGRTNGRARRHRRQEVSRTEKSLSLNMIQTTMFLQHFGRDQRLKLLSNDFGRRRKAVPTLK